MISKELLSNVLDEDVKEVELWNKNSIRYFAPKDYIINIHELAHLVKEWARTEKQILLASSSNGICEFVRKDIEATYADTEPEAIFKAGEWILKEISK